MIIISRKYSRVVISIIQVSIQLAVTVYGSGTAKQFALNVALVLIKRYTASTAGQSPATGRSALSTMT